MTEFYMHEYLPFLPIAPRIALAMAFRLFTNLKPHPSQMKLVRLIIRFEEQKVAGGHLQSLDWTGGLDWWTGLMD